MPRTLKRRSDALNDVPNDSSSESPQPTQRRRRLSSSSAASSHSNAEPPTQTSSHGILIKKLVRLALSTEYSRTPLRRADISTKVLTEAHSRQFRPVFDGAQKILRDSFGMEMVELPGREKTALKDRRTQATQNAARKEKETQKETQSRSQNAAAAATSGSKAWILCSTLPNAYKTHPEIMAPTRAPTQESEATYTALYSFIVSLIYLNNGALAENKLERYLKRMNVDTYTPLEISTEKLLQKMSKEGYVEKRRDTSTGDEIVEWIVAPRGKVEIGPKGVAGLVKSVYGFGSKHVANHQEQEGAVKEDEEELDERLVRSLGIKDPSSLERDGVEMVDVDANSREEDAEAGPQRRPKTRRKRGAAKDDEDEDDE